MAYSRLLNPRNLALFSALGLGGSYFVVKSKTVAEKQKARADGDYTVTVDRSGGGI